MACLCCGSYNVMAMQVSGGREYQCMEDRCFWTESDGEEKCDNEECSGNLTRRFEESAVYKYCNE